MRLPKWVVQLILCLIGWRLFLGGLAFLSTIFFKEYAPTFPYAEMLNQYGPWWLVRWGSFDGVHYLTIVTDGYKAIGLIQAFFPFYPLLAKGIAQLLHFNPFLSLVTVSHVSLIVGCIFFRMWLRELGLSSKMQRWAMALMLLFPGAYSFGAIYTESLYFALISIALWGMQRKQLLFTGVGGLLLSATRVVGVLLSPVVFLQSFTTASKAERWKMLFTSGTMTLGLAAYSMYLWRQFQDPLYFFHVQQAFNTGRESSIILLPQVFYRAGRMLISLPILSREWYVVAQDTYLTLLLIAVLGFATWNVWKRRHLLFSPQILLYCWAAVLLPTLTGTLQSMSRYGLAVVPFFALLGVWAGKHPRAGAFLLILHAILLCINTMFFLQGRFIS